MYAHIWYSQKRIPNGNQISNPFTICRIIIIDIIIVSEMRDRWENNIGRATHGTN